MRRSCTLQSFPLRFPCLVLRPATSTMTSSRQASQPRSRDDGRSGSSLTQSQVTLSSEVRASCVPLGPQARMQRKLVPSYQPRARFSAQRAVRTSISFLRSSTGREPRRFMESGRVSSEWNPPYCREALEDLTLLNEHEGPSSIPVCLQADGLDCQLQ